MNVNFYSDLIQAALKRSLDPRHPYVLWDFPNHPNVGDSAIWQGELKALKLFFGKSPVHTCELLPASEKLPTFSTKTQIIIHGGGNLGDLWERHQIFRERIITNYPNNRIVQMPQSIYFGDQAKLRQCRHVFSSHADLCIMVRDHSSYEIAQSLHSGQTELVPDMALVLGDIPRPSKPTTPILALMRMDKEKLVADDEDILQAINPTDWINDSFGLENRLLHNLKRVERKVSFFDPLIRPLKEYLFYRLSQIRTHRGCTILSSGEVVITDRLHAHILCSQMKIPHVIIDNSYGKLSSFRKVWNTGSDMMCLEASSLADAFDKAQYLLKSKETSV